jgi:hypothetical protein
MPKVRGFPLSLAVGIADPVVFVFDLRHEVGLPSPLEIGILQLLLGVLGCGGSLVILDTLGFAGLRVVDFVVGDGRFSS